MPNLDSLLLNVSISSFPHEEVFDYVFHGLPGQKIPFDVVEIFSILLYRLFE